jgi:short subunit dehydrogenase-like uncharacterized protein
MSILVYGAYGYTGRLIVTEALARGHRPIIAGRDRAKTTAMAAEHGLEARIFSLDDTKATRTALDGVDVVLHAAGPFSITSKPMVDACLACGASYLDITGEIDVFEAIYARHDEAMRERVALVPGVGFDVVPTDCLARMLKEALPDATHLELAFRSKGGASRGTARTAVLGLGTGGRERRDGRIVDVAPALHVKTIPFPRGPRTAMSIPWGDVSSAFRTTEIPNIVTLMSASESMAKNTQRAAAFAFLAKNRLVTRALLALVDRGVTGPDDDTRAKGFVEVWGEVRNATGARVSGTMLVPEGYTFTALAAVRAIEHVVANRPIGALTPALAFGAAFVTTVPGVEVGPLAKSA